MILLVLERTVGQVVDEALPRALHGRQPPQCLTTSQLLGRIGLMFLGRAEGRSVTHISQILHESCRFVQGVSHVLLEHTLVLGRDFDQ